LSFLCIGLALAGFAVYNRAWFREILAGPVAVSPAELSQAKGLESLPSRYVCLQDADSKETGVRHVGGRGRHKVTEYVLIRVADRWLVAAMESGPRPRTVVGYLGTWAGGDWDADVLPEIARKLPQSDAQRLLPFRLDAKQDHDGVGRVLLFGSVGLSLLSFAVAGLYLRKLCAKPPPDEGPLLGTAPGNTPAGEEWRWR
jgi:hypothetical protein